MQRTFTFSNVAPSYADDAFDFHISVAERDSHIWPRTHEEIRQYADEGCLFAARHKGAFVALCYAALDKTETAWEVGGLTVESSFQKLGIGILLVRLVLAHTLANAQPWRYGQQILAHVHEDNNAPRRLLETLGFRWHRQIEVPASPPPPASMKRNANGMVVGDEFMFTQDGLRALSQWFDEFDGKMSEDTLAEFGFGLHSIDDLRVALREMMQELDQRQ